MLGRDLLRSENIHHINGDRSDNRTDGPLRRVGQELRSGNLALWSKAQPAGQAIPDKLDWAADLLLQYGDLDSEPLRRVLDAYRTAAQD